MSQDIIWQDPPATAVMKGQQRGQYAAFITALKQRPNEWAILPGEKASADSAKGTAQNIRTGRMRGFTKGEFETAVDGTTIYVRYVPPVDGEASAPDGGEQNDEIAVGAAQHRAADVRAWARANGFSDIPDRGRLPQHVIAAFEEAQDGSDD